MSFKMMMTVYCLSVFKKKMMMMMMMKVKTQIQPPRQKFISRAKYLFLWLYIHPFGDDDNGDGYDDDDDTGEATPEHVACFTVIFDVKNFHMMISQEYQPYCHACLVSGHPNHRQTAISKHQRFLESLEKVLKYSWY